MSKVLTVGIIGLGGFCQKHHESILALEKQGLCKLLCTCDPEPYKFQDKMAQWEFEQRGVQVFDHYLKMLDAFGNKLDVVTIPTPIPFHAEMHRACVDRGIAVYLEKPPTVNYAELEEMLEVDKKAVKLTNVGFNFIVEESRQALKKRILAGELGKTKELRFCGMWPRPISYFRRGTWPGRLMMDGRLVLDSCMSNAMGHYIHNLLFWCGKGGLLSWGSVTEVEAELYRANDIEGFDTVFAKAKTEEGEDIQIALTHALSGKQSQYEQVICESATLTYVVGRDFRIDWNDGSVETGEPDKRDFVIENLRLYLQYVLGEVDRPLNRIIDTKPFVEFCDLVYISAGSITQVPDAYIERDENCVAVPGMREAVEKYFQTGLYPSGQAIEWACPGGRATIGDLPRLEPVVKAMLIQG